MAAPLRFLIELFDKVSGPATKASDALDGLNKTTEKATAASAAMDKQDLKSKISIANKALEVPRLQQKLERLNRELRGGTKDTQKWGEGWASKLTAITTAGTAAFNVMRSVARGATQAGLAMFEAGARQDMTNRAFKNLLGDGGPAVQKYLSTIEGATEFTANQLEDLTLPLARQGFGVEDIKRLLPAALDVQAKGGSAQQAIEQFVKIASTGRIEGEAFKALGLSEQDALTAMGRITGIVDVQQIKKAISTGKIGSKQVLEGVLASIAKGGKLGDAAVEAATSPAAALNKFRNISETIFSRLADSKALPKITKALEDFTRAVTSEKVVDGLLAFVDQVGEAVKGVDWSEVTKSVVSVLKVLARLGFGAVDTVSQTGKSIEMGPVEHFKQTFGIGGDVGATSGTLPVLDKMQRMVEGAIGGGNTTSVNDFLARADGSVLKINSKDQVMGFKPGGAIEQAFSTRTENGTGSGGGKVVHVNFGGIAISGGASGADVEAFKAAAREVVEDVFQDYVIEEGVG